MTTWGGLAQRRLSAAQGLVAVLFGVVMLTSAILAGSLGNSGLLAARAVSAALSNPISGDAGLQLQTRMGDLPAAQDDLVRSTLTSSFAPIPITVWTSSVSEPKEASVDGESLAGRVRLAASPQLTPDNLKLTDGAWPDGDTGAALQRDAAGRLGLTVGDVIDVSGVSLTVTGLWEAEDPAAAMWLGDPLMGSGVDGTTFGPLVVAPEVVAASGSPFLRWVVAVGKVKPSQLSLLAERAQNAARAVKEADVSGRGIVVTGDLGPTAAQAARDSASGDAFGFLPVSVLILVAIVGLGQVAALLARAREPHDSLLMARGAGLRQVLAVSLAESLAVSLLGAGVGTGIAAVVMRLAAGDWGQSPTVALGGLAAALLAVGCLAAVNAASAVRIRRGHQPRSDRVRGVAGAALLVLVAVLAAVATWQLRAGDGFVRVDEDGRVRLDVVAALSPALLLAASGVVALVLLAPITRLAEVGARSLRLTGAWLAGAQVSRGLLTHAVTVVLTVLATGTATFSALFAGTATGLAADVATVRQAAPLRVALEEPADPEPFALPAVTDVPGVTATVPAWREDRAQVGDLLVPLVAAPLDALGGVADLPPGTALPDGLASDGSLGIPLPAGIKLSVQLGADVSLDPWQSASLAAYPQLARANAEAAGIKNHELTAEDLEAAFAQDLTAVSVGVILQVSDPATGLTAEYATGQVSVQPGPLRHDANFGNLRLDPAKGQGATTVTLPTDRPLVLDGVRFRTVESPWSDRTARFTLAIAGDGEPLLGAATAGWVSDVALPVGDLQPYEEAEREAQPATAEVTEFETEDGRPGHSTVTNAPPQPSAVIDTTSEQWVLTSRVGLSGGDASSDVRIVSVGPGLAFTGTDPLGAHHPTAASARGAVPVALTPETSRASSLVVGDRVDLVAFGTRVPGEVAAITEVVPSAEGDLGMLVDSVTLSQVLLARGAAMPWPDEMWAGIDGDPAAVRGAVQALPGVASATTATGATGTAEVAASALWVASACAVALAAAGLAASAATMTATRRPEVAVLRALGMTPSAQARSRAVENGAVLALSTLLGVAAGWVVGGAVVRQAALSATLENPAFDVALRFTWLPWAVILAVGALSAAAIVAWQAGLVRRQARDTQYREEVR